MDDLTGQRFGTFIVVGRVAGFRRRWHVHCQCGHRLDLQGTHLPDAVCLHDGEIVIDRKHKHERLRPKPPPAPRMRKPSPPRPEPLRVHNAKPERNQQVIQLVNKGMSYTDVRRVLQMSRSAVCGVVYRHRQKLKGSHGQGDT
jgi:hypothetical protein